MECLLVCGIAGAFVLGLLLGGGACGAKLDELEMHQGLLMADNELLKKKINSLLEAEDA